jgi:hypothetical protein
LIGVQSTPRATGPMGRRLAQRNSSPLLGTLRQHCDRATRTHRQLSLEFRVANPFPANA